MGNFAYCKICRIPVKDFDSGGPPICGHQADLDYSVFSSGTDHEEALDSWNLNHPDRPVTIDMAYCAEPNPYAAPLTDHQQCRYKTFQ